MNLALRMGESFTQSVRPLFRTSQIQIQNLNKRFVSVQKPYCFCCLENWTSAKVYILRKNDFLFLKLELMAYCWITIENKLLGDIPPPPLNTPNPPNQPYNPPFNPPQKRILNDFPKP